MRMRAAMALVVATSWCVCCWMYWQRAVPLLPAWSIPLNGRVVDFARVATDPLILRSNETGRRHTGPVEIVIPDKTFQSRLALQKGDEFLGHDRNGSRAAIRRDGVLGMVDLATDTFLPLSLPTAEPQTVWFAADGRILLVQLKMDIHAFDVRTAKPIWERRSAVRMVIYGAPDAPPGTMDDSAFVTLSDPIDYPERIRIHYANVWTGREVKWITQLGSIRSGVASPCGRYLLVTERSGDGTMHDATSGAVLWRTEEKDFPLQSRGLTFSDDGEELLGRYAGPSVSLGQARWKSATGIMLEAPPKGAIALDNRDGQPSRYKVDKTTPGALERLVERCVSWAWIRLGKTAKTSGPKSVALFDTKSPGRQLGLITSPSDDSSDRSPTDWISGDDRVLIRARQTLNYYTIPPHRDWAKLALWCIVPPAVITFILAVIRQVRMQLRPLEAGPPEPAQTPSAL